MVLSVTALEKVREIDDQVLSQGTRIKKNYSTIEIAKMFLALLKAVPNEPASFILIFPNKIEDCL